MQYLFMGIFCEKSREGEYLTKARRGVQGAVNAFQWNLLDGFLENHADMTIVDTMPVGTWPTNYSQLFFGSRKWQYGSMPCVEPAFVNLPVVKQGMRTRGYIRAANKWIEQTDGDKTILIYSLYPPFLKAAAQIKRDYPDVKVCVIVTDLPGKYGVKRKKLKTWFDSRSFGRLERVDSFVLLTEAMKEPLQVGDRPYVVVEGICNEKGSLPDAAEKKKAVLYGGSLNPVYGILDLVNAFREIEDPDCQLWICGKGSAEEEIRRCAAVEPRIQYKGYLSKQEIYRLQAQAAVLINPRKNEGEYTKYSFPSKTMEYMISGTPVLMYALDGVPEEYWEYGYFIGPKGLPSLKEGLEYVLGLSEDARRKMGAEAREFVLKNKNGVVQAGKVLCFLENI